MPDNSMARIRSARPALRAAYAAEEPGIYRHGSAHARAWDWREHSDLLRGTRHAAQATALCPSGTACRVAANGIGSGELSDNRRGLFRLARAEHDVQRYEPIFAARGHECEWGGASRSGRRDGDAGKLLQAARRSATARATVRRWRGPQGRKPCGAAQRCVLEGAFCGARGRLREDART